MSDAVVERAPAKINLDLRIVSREPDGYHRLETIFQALELHDVIEARAADTMSLRVDGAIDVGPEGDNLVMRAARAFRDAVPGAPLAAIRLVKRIPAGAGLGGGSSDAAAALRALDRLAGSALPDEALSDIGVALGSDVPFFLCGSPLARATGRGEILEPLPVLEPAHVVLVDPGFPVSTRDAFAWWDERHGGAPAEAARRARADTHAPIDSFAALAAHARNDFEEVVFERHPPLGAVKAGMLAAGAIGALLSGSGSCVYGIFEDERSTESAARALHELVPDARVLRTRTAR